MMFMCVVRWRLGKEVLLETGFVLFSEAVEQQRDKTCNHLIVQEESRQCLQGHRAQPPTSSTVHSTHRIIDSPDFYRTLCSVSYEVHGDRDQWMGRAQLKCEIWPRCFLQVGNG